MYPIDLHFLPERQLLLRKQMQVRTCQTFSPSSCFLLRSAASWHLPIFRKGFNLSPLCIITTTTSVDFGFLRRPGQQQQQHWSNQPRRQTHLLIRRGRRLPTRRPVPSHPRRPLPDLRQTLPASLQTRGAQESVREETQAARSVEA